MRGKLAGTSDIPAGCSFNEARALCAGSPGIPSDGFNEARALCAGNFPARVSISAKDLQ